MTSLAPLDSDVLVVGSGVAGFVAALRARSAGARVVVVGKSGGASGAWSGAVDVADDLAGAVPGPAHSALDRGAPVEDAIAAIAARLPRHPYARLGAARVNVRSDVRDAMKFIVDAVPTVALTARADGRNHVLATQLGTLKRTAFVARSQLLDLGELLPSAVVGVVEWRDLAGFNARPVTEMLRFACGLGDSSGAARAPRFVDVVVPRVVDGDVFLTQTDLARALDDDALRARFLNALQLRLSTMAAAGEPAPTHLLVPPCFGSAPPSTAMLDAASQQLGGRPLRELLALPPSVPGDRLLSALRKAAVAAGVEVVEGGVTAPRLTGRRVVGVDVVRGGERQALATKHVVLAAGRFFGGGLERSHIAREALFGLPVVVDGVPVADQFIGSLTGELVDADHAIFRAGVAVDEDLRPLSGRQVALDNVTCAGSIIGGFDLTRDGAALGVVVWTSWLAGMLAASNVGGGRS